MPHKPRIDIPGVCQHVMARGVDGMKIYRTKKDYKTFLKILGDIHLYTEKESSRYMATWYQVFRSRQVH